MVTCPLVVMRMILLLLVILIQEPWTGLEATGGLGTWDSGLGTWNLELGTLGFRAHLRADARDLHQQLLELRRVLIGRRRFLPRFQFLELRLELRAPAHDRGLRRVGGQRERRVRLPIRDSRHGAVGAGILRFAPDAGAGVVEERALGPQLA